VRGLTKRYGRLPAVDALSFDVGPGVVTGFLGPNGSGKSTTMRLMLGLDGPGRGAVRIAGRRYCELGWPLREVSALLETRAFHPGRSARAHLAALAASNAIPFRRVDEVLGLVGLESAAGRRGGVLPRHDSAAGHRGGAAVMTSPTGARTLLPAAVAGAAGHADHARESNRPDLGVPFSCWLCDQDRPARRERGAGQRRRASWQEGPGRPSAGRGWPRLDFRRGSYIGVCGNSAERRWNERILGLRITPSRISIARLMVWSRSQAPGPSITVRRWGISASLISQVAEFHR